MTTYKDFKRGIHNRDFLNALNDLYNDADSFWSKMVKDLDLFIAIRDEYLNVYFNGQSMCLLKFDAGSCSVIGCTHNKYLSKNSSGYTVSYDRSNGIDELDDVWKLKNVISNEAMNDSVKQKFIGKEKRSSYSEILNSNNCLDVEATFVNVLVANPKKKSDYKISSIDYVNLEAGVLRFYEAKHFSNQEVKSRTEPRVFEQLRRYEEVLNACRDSILPTYSKVLENKNTLTLPCPSSSVLDIDTIPNLKVFGVPKKPSSAEEDHIQKLRDSLGKRLTLIEEK